MIHNVQQVSGLQMQTREVLTLHYAAKARGASLPSKALRDLEMITVTTTSIRATVRQHTCKRPEGALGVGKGQSTFKTGMRSEHEMYRRTSDFSCRLKIVYKWLIKQLTVFSTVLYGIRCCVDSCDQELGQASDVHNQSAHLDTFPSRRLYKMVLPSLNLFFCSKQQVQQQVQHKPINACLILHTDQLMPCTWKPAVAQEADSQKTTDSCALLLQTTMQRWLQTSLKALR